MDTAEQFIDKVASSSSSPENPISLKFPGKAMKTRSHIYMRFIAGNG
ncbi:hypothetical protein KCP73_20615 [Salmonella enterica subsp. enterica]|nr:hypothetical protein KCP73_20615 [Salmonella enterica subsp. enterica]